MTGGGPPATVAAIATATGGGVGIVRVSGPEAEAILRRVFRPWPGARPQSHRLYLGEVFDPTSGERIDQVLACVMRRPRSYTGEDVAELHGHGGARVLARVLEAVVAAGARVAEPGEFTRRAFENGRIDLTRAEAVADLVLARSDEAMRAAAAVLSGALEREVRGARSAVVRVLAELEGAIDFPDEQLETSPAGALAARLDEEAARLKTLAGSYRRHLREAALVVLVGRVNAGKSSLLNALAGEERALVDEAAGTTRDAVEVEVALGGLALRLVDTAGQREDGAVPEGSVEARGIALGGRWLARADLGLVVVDGGRGFGDEERALYEALAGRPRLVVWNKRDLGAPRGALPDGAAVVATVATVGEGLDELRAAIVQALSGERSESPLSVSLRQKEALEAAAASLARGAAELREGQSEEVVAVALRDGLHHLGRVTGETVDAGLLDAIFARFCIGK